MNIFQKFCASLRLREAIKKAEAARLANNTRYYVMPTFGKKAHLIIVDRKNFRILKRKGYLRHDIGIKDLIRECFYCTAYPNGSGWLRPEDAKRKRLQYFTWCESVRRMGRTVKKVKKK